MAGVKFLFAGWTKLGVTAHLGQHHHGTLSTQLQRFPRLMSTDTAKVTHQKDAEQRRPNTGILMMTMGGPNTEAETSDFLMRLFTDPDIIDIPFGSVLGPWIAKRRTPSIAAKYKTIGGSQILKWTNLQGENMVRILDDISPETAPHKFYVGFRYAHPLTSDALECIEKDGVKRMVAFSQYPHYSCSTSGSSLNDLYNQLSKSANPSKVAWSVIDRWPTHQGFVDTYAALIKDELSKFPAEVRDKVVILFSAHSLPMKRVNRGDPYPSEVGGTVMQVMKKLNYSHPYSLVWQSKVGPVDWLSPQTDVAMEALVKRNQKNLLLVPIAFTTDHIETLHEMDIEYCKELGEKIGVENVRRVAAPNDHPLFVKALADIVHTHLKSGKRVSKQMMQRCSLCPNIGCHDMRQWFAGSN